MQSLGFYIILCVSYSGKDKSCGGRLRGGMVIRMRYGLIGEKLGHSYSKLIHEKLADYPYELIPLTREEFERFMEARAFTAINVTIPYKQAVIPYLDELHPLAAKIGAVNTIVNKNGRLTGYNTDYYGFLYMLMHHGIEVTGRKCLVLGNGGTSHTVRTLLRDLGASELLIVNRRETEDTITYEECYRNHTDAEIIVNTTPCGMYPNTEASPLDLSSFRRCEAVLDAIFNPLRTKLTLQAQELNIKAVTGLEMLVAQAKQAVEHFLDKKLSEELIDLIYKELLEVIRDTLPLK